MTSLPPAASSVQCYLRPRPTIRPSPSVTVTESSALRITDGARASEFPFDGVLSSADDVWSTVGQPMTAAAMNGTDSAVILFGQIASGKTFTINGARAHLRGGLIASAIAAAFDGAQTQSEWKYEFAMSIVEVYGDALIDLTAQSERTALMIHDEADGAVDIRGLSKREVASAADAIQLVAAANAARHKRVHPLHVRLHDVNTLPTTLRAPASSPALSSRSHVKYTIHIRATSLRADAVGVIRQSELSVVDLAGSERNAQNDTETTTANTQTLAQTAQALAESKSINRSLSYVQHCIIALRSASAAVHVPFRQCKLTHILRPILNGKCALRVVVTALLDAAHVDETIRTAQFAMKLRGIETRAVPNVRTAPEQLLIESRREIRHLKQELAMHDQVVFRRQIQYDQYSAEEKAALNDEVEAFVAGKQSEIDFDNLRKLRETLFAMREIIRRERLRNTSTQQEQSVVQELSVPTRTVKSASVIISSSPARIGRQSVFADESKEQIVAPEPTPPPMPPPPPADIIVPTAAATAVSELRCDAAMAEFIATTDGYALSVAVSSVTAEVAAETETFARMSVRMNQLAERIRSIKSTLAQRVGVLSSSAVVLEESDVSLVGELRSSKAEYDSLRKKRAECGADVQCAALTRAERKAAFKSAFKEWMKQAHAHCILIDERGQPPIKAQ